MLSLPCWRPLIGLVTVGSILSFAGSVGATGQEYELPGPPAFGFDIAPDGTILVAQGDTVWEIHKGQVRAVAQVPTETGSVLHDVAASNRGNFWTTSGGLDLALGAGVWHIARGRVRLLGDIEAFETANDPDALEGPMWKDPRCEQVPPFTAGPQSNPYHMTLLSGGEALVADAAGNTLLSVRRNGDVDWVAVFTPPGETMADWPVLFPDPIDGEATCYVQPVPTSVAVGPDGAYYVGELTGFSFGDVTGMSRIWRVAPGARNVTCPSADCEVVVNGLTSVVDVEFGPDGLLYVVELDRNGWFAATVLGIPAGGQVSSCDVQTGLCTVVAGADPLSLLFPGGIAFDKWGGLWLLDNTFAPTIRRIDS